MSNGYQNHNKYSQVSPTLSRTLQTFSVGRSGVGDLSEEGHFNASVNNLCLQNEKVKKRP